LTKIIAIGTAVPPYKHKQSDILLYMQHAYNINTDDKRKLAFLYNKSAITTRHSVLADFDKSSATDFFKKNSETAFASIDNRMKQYQQHALPLALAAINNCINEHIANKSITHLITVSCTGMSAPGLDLEILEALQLQPNIYRTSINFMGCYAAIHALKMADMICSSSNHANVLIVCVELCTLHFQKEFNIDNAASSMLFADGAAAVLVSNTLQSNKQVAIKGFYSQVALSGKNDMTWKLSEKGFLMTLSSYVPQLIEADIKHLFNSALQQLQLSKTDITHWCIHPGGKAILDAIKNQLQLSDANISKAKSVLDEYGNMSSPTILFVLKKIMEDQTNVTKNIFGVAFGPGLTMETFIAEKHEI
jgi:predicted naringenin-chalcone synthase